MLDIWYQEKFFELFFFWFTFVISDTFLNIRYLIVTKCVVVSPALEKEVKTEVKKEEAGIVLKPKVELDDKSKFNNGSGILLKPKQELVAKSAAQIVHEQRMK